MNEFINFAELAKVFGFPALIFTMWYLYHKSSNAQLTTIIEQQNKREEDNFTLLKDMIENNIIQNGLLSQIRELIINNQWCPYMKEFQRKGKDQ